MKNYILIALFSCSSLLFADAIDQLKLQDPRNQETIRARKERIHSVQDLDTLFKEVEKLEEFGQLEWVIDEGKTQWVATSAKIVREIGIKTGLREKVTIDKLRSKFIGSPDSQYARHALVAELIDYLATAGYPHAQVQLKVRESQGFTDYDILVWLGQPCLIGKIKSTLRFPNDIKLNLKRNEICNLDHIHEQVEVFERELINNGYQNSLIEITKVEYSADFSSLELTLGGSIGKYTSFEFIDESRFLFGNALDEDTLLYINKNFSDPQQAKTQAIEYFKNKGYEFVKIRGPLRQIDEDGSTSYLYYVNPGDKYQINDLVLNGTHTFNAEDVKKSTFDPGIADLFSFGDSKTLEQVNDAIIGFYHGNGFWDAKVQRTYLEFVSKSKFAIAHTTIQEGKQRKLKSITVRGTKNLNVNEIVSLVATKPGEPVRQDDISQLEYRIREKYFENGYIEAKTEVTVNNHPDESGNFLNTEIVVDISEGPLVHIGMITIKGLVTTNDIVARRELLFKQGDVYNQDLINQSRTALLNLGIFSAVSIERSDWISPHSHEVDLTLHIREGDAGRVKFGPGYNLVRGLQYASEVSYSNLGGQGRRINLRGAISEERQQKSIIGDREEKSGRTLFGRKIGISYTEPHIFELPWNGNISILHQATADDIWKISNSLEVSMSHNFRRGYFGSSSITPFYRYQLLRDEGTPSQADSLTTTGFSRIGSVGIRFRLDNRDNLSFPTKGYLLNTELSWARYEVLSEYRYFKWHFGSSAYQKIVRNLVFAFGLQLTAYENVRRKHANTESVDVLPANQRLLAGGSNDVRGFEQQLGPYVLTTNRDEHGRIIGLNKEVPLGGTNLFILKAELRKQLWSELFAMSLFWDAGNSFFTADELSKFTQKFENTATATQNRSVEDNFNYTFASLLTHPENLWTKNYQSAGLAFSLLTPLGALNASVGWPIHEPQSLNCQFNNVCNMRAKSRSYWLQKYQVVFNIGAEF